MFSTDEQGRVWVDTPWPRETAFSLELLASATWVNVSVVQGVPVRVLVACQNGTADYGVTAVDELNGVVLVRLHRCSRTPSPHKATAPTDPKAVAVGLHSSGGCYGQLRRAPGGPMYCEACGWTFASGATR